MDPIRITTQPVIITQTLPSLPDPVAAPVALPDPTPQPAQPDSNAAEQASYNAQAAEQQRVETLQRMAQGIANVYVVSDQKFTIFKDVTGQYITRFTSLRDGKVTYIPEPSLFKMSGGSDMPPLIKLQA